MDVCLPDLPLRLSYIPSKAHALGVRVRVPVPDAQPLVRWFRFSTYEHDIQATIDAASDFCETSGQALWGEDWHPQRRYVAVRTANRKGMVGVACKGNKGGVVGVIHSVRHRVGKKGTTVYACWIATWMEAGKLRTKQFNYTDKPNGRSAEAAKAAAVALRQEMEQQHYHQGV